MICIATLVACGIGPTQARIFAEPLLSACARFDITTPARIGAFLGQCLVESQRFTKTEEGLFYRGADRIMAVFPSRVTSLQQAAQLVGKPEALANCVYAGKNGNGNPLSGDGWRFRGRGLIQLTGRGNYTDAGDGLGRPYLLRPELVAEPADACLTAAWYWHNGKLNVLADASLFDAITKAVNGPGMHDADLRRQLSEEAIKALH